MGTMREHYHQPESDIAWYLCNWARMMRSGCSPQTLPKESSAMTGLPNYIYDPQGQYDEADMNAAMATDAAIRDLVPIESCAIHHVYLAAVFRFRRSTLPIVLDLAQQHVQAILTRRGMFVKRTLDTARKQA